ncbi:MAG: pyruvate, phosphate dikinase [Rhodospirillaceae bacterium]|nr:MAG: pyruvate, phosphate dikinase [Rhodospirillaceae bacterium]
MADKWTYAFGNGQAEGNRSMLDLLGGKGANLHEMSSIGLNVPPGFTLTTEICSHFIQTKGEYPEALVAEVTEAIQKLETIIDAKFGGGNGDQVLLLSVRSGARASMPGMMDTVLNLGLNAETVESLARATGDERFAYDSYRRFVQMFGDVVLGVEHYHFEDVLEEYKFDHGLKLDTDLSVEDWKTMVQKFMDLIEAETGKSFPSDPKDQLWAAIGAVFKSWTNKRAVTYRRLYNIPDGWGTAVNVQAMVFGNMGKGSATGVCFTRNPSTGENAFFGEFLENAQGEDVVSGVRTPQSLTALERQATASDLLSFEELMPDLYKELNDVRLILEKHYKDMQDMEFTVQQGRLWILQTRTGKRTVKAALQMAVDMANEGLIDKDTAILRVDPDQLDQILHPTLDPDAQTEVLGHGLPASPGAASGKLVFNADDAAAWAARGEDVILARVETSPDDINGMYVAKGVLTMRGGMTSHAAVVARGMGTPCVSGAGGIRIDCKAKTLSSLGEVLNEGDVITINGVTGEVLKGSVPTVEPKLDGAFSTLMEWADKVRVLNVRANAETLEDVVAARRFGAQGIGLARTEHMFFNPQRIVHVREMILAPNQDTRLKALDKLGEYQCQDFVQLFEVMDGLPVTIRLLDPPLHEFLPSKIRDIENVAAELNMPVEDVKKRTADLYETNPMLGHRGCRLGITYPEIYEMQVRAIFEAACNVKASEKIVIPEIMIPLIASLEEFSRLKALVINMADTVLAEYGVKIPYTVGSMIELPRACLQAGLIAEEAEFFSFGTNDLTQTTFGLSRDDAAPLLQSYLEKGVLRRDPFVSLDQSGVGELVKMGTARGRSARPDLKVGVCGEHGGDPRSVNFFHNAGLDYVSCSPYRVPIARLAAAQAALGVVFEDKNA